MGNLESLRVNTDCMCMHAPQSSPLLVLGSGAQTYMYREYVMYMWCCVSETTNGLTGIFILHHFKFPTEVIVNPQSQAITESKP